MKGCQAHESAWPGEEYRFRSQAMVVATLPLANRSLCQGCTPRNYFQLTHSAWMDSSCSYGSQALMAALETAVGHRKDRRNRQRVSPCGRKDQNRSLVAAVAADLLAS